MYIAKSNINSCFSISKIFFNKQEALEYICVMKTFCNTECQIDEVKTPTELREINK